LQDLVEHIARKYGASVAESMGKPDNPLTTAGTKVGIAFNPSRRIIRTTEGHMLVEWCKRVAPEKEDLLMEVLFRRYFEQGQDLSQSAALLEAAEEAGLPRKEAETMLASGCSMPSQPSCLARCESHVGASVWLQERDRRNWSRVHWPGAVKV